MDRGVCVCDYEDQDRVSWVDLKETDASTDARQEPPSRSASAPGVLAGTQLKWTRLVHARDSAEEWRRAAGPNGLRRCPPASFTRI